VSTGSSPLRLATRGTPLARRQAAEVAERLAALAGVGVETVVVRTTGDQRASVPLWQLGGQGVFVAEVRAALLEGRADLAVHSAKDLPAAPVPGLGLAAVPPRADPRDVLVGGSLQELRPGAVVASGAPRRRAQLAWWRPDLRFVELRGSIGTRLGRLDQVDAVAVAAAALDRLGLAPEGASPLPTSVVLPQVGQGALAIECRADDEPLLDLLGALDHPPSRRAVLAERAFLAAMGGGCQAAVGALARPAGDGEELTLEVLAASPDGHLLVRRQLVGADPAALGAAGAEALAVAGADLVTGPLR
jgi:hydroxymethylbilane synthase